MPADTHSLHLTDAADDDETFNPVANALAHADTICRPVVRSLFNYIATKISSLTNVEISSLTDDEIAFLVKTPFFRLPPAQLDRLTDAEFSRLIAIADSPSGAPAIENFVTEIMGYFVVSLITPVFIVNQIATVFAMVIKFALSVACFAGASFICGFVEVLYKLYKELSSTQYVTTNATQRELLRSSKRSIFLSKYSRMPDLKGLKGIGQIYRREI